MKYIFSKYNFIYFALYSLVFGLSLLYPSMYWDDYVLIDVPKELVVDDFYKNGRPLFGLYHLLVLSLPYPVYTYKLITFFTYFLSGLLFLSILENAKWFDDNFNKFLTLLFVFVPFNASKHSLVMSQYGVMLVCFLTTFYLFSCSTLWEKPILRIIASLLLLVSGSLEVHLILTYPILALFYKTKKGSFKSFYPLLLMPIFYWLLRSLFFKPQEVYQGFHSISFLSVLNSFWQTLKVFYTSGIAMIYDFKLAIFQPDLYIFSALPILVCFLFFVSNKNSSHFQRGFLIKTFFVGIILFYFAAFPFYVVGKPIYNVDWSMRGQHLQTLGAALAFNSVLHFFRGRARNILTFLVMAAFIQLNILYEWEYYRDYIKQQSLTLNFADSSEIENNTTFTVMDETIAYNARSREYRFFDWGGLLERTFGNEERFASNSGQIIPWDTINYGYMPIFYRVKDYVHRGVEHVIVIKIDKGFTIMSHIPKLLTFSKKDLLSDIKGYFVVKALPSYKYFIPQPPKAFLPMDSKNFWWLNDFGN